MHVLYVDDDLTMTKSVKLMLAADGHTCDTTYLGERAAELAKYKSFDVIILDIMLPDIDGYDVIERLREAQVSTPILIQTGLVDRAKPGDAEAFGADDILIKPFDKDELIGHLERVIARPAGAAAIPARQAERAAKALEDRGIKASEPCEILFDGKTAQGTVLNLSLGGAALRLPQELSNPPKELILKSAAGQTFPCRICWQVKDKIGVAFV